MLPLDISIGTLAYTVFALLGLCFLLDYFRKSKVTIHYSSPQFSKFVHTTFQKQSLRFFPFPPLFFSFGQTYLSFQTYQDDKNLVLTRESFDYPTGGTGHVEWITTKDETKQFHPNVIAFILPGLRSRPETPYLRDIYSQLINGGIRPVLFVPRFNDHKLQLPFSKPFNLVDDMHQGVLYVKKKYPEAKLIVIGHSYGANTVVNYMAIHNKESNFIAGVSIANPWDFHLCEAYCRGRRAEKHLVIDMKKIVASGSEDVIREAKHRSWSLDEIINGKTVVEMDSLFTSKAMGYKSHAEYYTDASSRLRIGDVKVPLFVINAVDDPLIDPKGLPLKAHLENPNILFVETKRGGHLGWVDGILKLRRWHLPIVVDFVKWIAEKS